MNRTLIARFMAFFVALSFVYTPVPAVAAPHVANTNVVSGDGTIWKITSNNCRQGYTSADAFLSNNPGSYFSDIVPWNADDAALPVCTDGLIYPRPGGSGVKDFYESSEEIVRPYLYKANFSLTNFVYNGSTNSWQAEMYVNAKRCNRTGRKTCSNFTGTVGLFSEDTADEEDPSGRVLAKFTRGVARTTVTLTADKNYEFVVYNRNISGSTFKRSRYEFNEVANFSFDAPSNDSLPTPVPTGAPVITGSSSGIRPTVIPNSTGQMIMAFNISNPVGNPQLTVKTLQFKLPTYLELSNSPFYAPEIQASNGVKINTNVGVSRGPNDPYTIYSFDMNEVLAPGQTSYYKLVATAGQVGSRTEDSVTLMKANYIVSGKPYVQSGFDSYDYNLTSYYNFRISLNTDNKAYVSNIQNTIIRPGYAQALVYRADILAPATRSISPQSLVFLLNDINNSSSPYFTGYFYNITSKPASSNQTGFATVITGTTDHYKEQNSYVIKFPTNFTIPAGQTFTLSLYTDVSQSIPLGSSHSFTLSTIYEAGNKIDLVNSNYNYVSVEGNPSYGYQNPSFSSRQTSYSYGGPLPLLASSNCANDTSRCGQEVHSLLAEAGKTPVIVKSIIYDVSSSCTHLPAYRLMEYKGWGAYGPFSKRVIAYAGPASNGRLMFDNLNLSIPTRESNTDQPIRQIVLTADLPNCIGSYAIALNQLQLSDGRIPEQDKTKHLTTVHESTVQPAYGYQVPTLQSHSTGWYTHPQDAKICSTGSNGQDCGQEVSVIMVGPSSSGTYNINNLRYFVSSTCRAGDYRLPTKFNLIEYSGRTGLNGKRVLQSVTSNGYQGYINFNNLNLSVPAITQYIDPANYKYLVLASDIPKCSNIGSGSYELSNTMTDVTISRSGNTEFNVDVYSAKYPQITTVDQRGYTTENPSVSFILPTSETDFATGCNDAICIPQIAYRGVTYGDTIALKVYDGSNFVGYVFPDDNNPVAILPDGTPSVSHSYGWKTGEVWNRVNGSWVTSPVSSGLPNLSGSPSQWHNLSIVAEVHRNGVTVASAKSGQFAIRPYPYNDVRFDINRDFEIDFKDLDLLVYAWKTGVSWTNNSRFDVDLDNDLDGNDVTSYYSFLMARYDHDRDNKITLVDVTMMGSITAGIRTCTTSTCDYSGNGQVTGLDGSLHARVEVTYRNSSSVNQSSGTLK